MSTTTRSVATDRRRAEARRWVLLCAAAEALGMTAAAGAATFSAHHLGDPPAGGNGVLALTLVVAGGLVEGTALGLAQASALRQRWPQLRRWPYVAVTVAVAGLGWAGASAPATVSGSGDGSAPPVLLVLVGAAGLGASMGAALGAVQAAVLRGTVPHPWRWVGANALAWLPAMVVIFAGATAPSADWPAGLVVVTGTVAGACAGALLGLLLAWSVPSLDGPGVTNRMVLGLLGSRAHGRAGRSLVGLRVRGRRTGRVLELPVMWAADRAGLVVLPGRAAHKTWWRNLRVPADVEVLQDGGWHPAVGRVLVPTDEGYAAARSTYGRRWPRVKMAPDALLVRIGPAS